MDIVSEIYSKPLAAGGVQGYRQLGGGPFERWRKYSIPIWHALKAKLSEAGQNVSTAVKEASATTLRKIADEIPAAASESVKRVLERGTEKFIERTLGKRKREASPPPPPAAKHKRGAKKARIDKLLGNDSY